MYTKEPIKKVDPSGINVVTEDGEIVWLATPFSALCVREIGLLNENSTVTVFEVGKTKTDELVFIVGSYYYHHSYFSIQL